MSLGFAHQRWSKGKLVAACVGVVALLLGIWLMAERAPVTLKATRLEIKAWSEDMAGQLGERNYVVARMELVNGSEKVIEFTGYDRSFPLYSLHFQTLTGWKDPTSGVIMCGTGLRPIAVGPHEKVCFEAVIDSNKPCKVAMHYTDGRSPNRLRQRLPQWFQQNIPWGDNWQVVRSEAVDARELLARIGQP